MDPRSSEQNSGPQRTIGRPHPPILDNSSSPFGKPTAGGQKRLAVRHCHAVHQRHIQVPPDPRAPLSRRGHQPRHARAKHARNVGQNACRLRLACAVPATRANSSCSTNAGGSHYARSAPRRAGTWRNRAIMAQFDEAGANNNHPASTTRCNDTLLDAPPYAAGEVASDGHRALVRHRPHSLPSARAARPLPPRARSPSYPPAHCAAHAGPFLPTSRRPCHRAARRTSCATESPTADPLPPSVLILCRRSARRRCRCPPQVQCRRAKRSCKAQR